MKSNFDFLNKNELSHILNNPSEFGDQFIKQIEDYCQRKKYAVDEIKSNSPEWQIPSQRLSLKIEQDSILLSKNEVSRSGSNKGLIFLGASVVSMIGVSLWMVFRNGDGETMSYPLYFIPIILLAIGNFFNRLKTKKAEQKELKIFNTSRAHLFKGGKLIGKNEIQGVNLFWTSDNEKATLNISLEFELKKDRSILIDNNSSYSELLKCGIDISQFINEKLQVINGESTSKQKVGL